MKINQKLPIALGLAGALMLASCSKEEAVAPQAVSEASGERSGLKENAEELPYMATTLGEPGLSLPADWVKYEPASYLRTGTSTFKWLWSNSLNPWNKPLPGIPTNVSANSMITTKSYTGIATEKLKISTATTVIKNLKPGKTYKLTVYVATTTENSAWVGGGTNVCAKSAEILIKPYQNGTSVKESIDLVGKEGQWVKKTITFSTDKTSAYFVFSGLAPHLVGYSYVHLFIDRESVKELNAFQPMTTQQMGL